MAAEPAYEPPVEPPAAPATRPVAARRSVLRRSGVVASLLARFALTLLGAAGLVIGGLLVWVRPASRVGTEIPVRFLWSTTGADTTAFVQTVGFVAVVLGLLAIVGLAFRSGWLTRMAGVLGIVEFVLFAITISRADGSSFPDAVGVGAWLALAGGIVALAGGLLGTRTVVTATPAAPTTGTTAVVDG